jgi:hypothetical protein
MLTALGYCAENLASLETLNMEGLGDGTKFMTLISHALPPGIYNERSTKFEVLLT